MFWILILIPFLTIFASLLLYRQVGKRDFLKLDFVQFLYAFVISPLVLVWIKSIILFLGRSESSPTLTQNQLFLIDTGFSLLFLYFFAFVVIHSLTKTFEVKLQRDPLFDLIAHSEEFHLWISHTSIYGITGIFLTLIGILNVFLPMDILLNRYEMGLVLLVGAVLGLLGYIGIWLSNFTAKKFMMLIQLICGALFVCLVLAYFFLNPHFSGEYALYWFIATIFASFSLSSQIIDRSPRSKSWISKFHHKHKDGWNENNFLLVVEKIEQFRKKQP